MREKGGTVIKDRTPSADAAELRRRAEALLGEDRAQGASGRTEGDVQRLVHELQVYQIELEMQNEELRRSRAEVEAGLERYSALYDFAPVGYSTLGRDGAIHQLNLAGAGLLGAERARLSGRRFDIFVAEPDRLAFNLFLEKVFTSRAQAECEVALLKEGGGPLHVHITAAASPDGQHCRVIIADITARKKIEAELASAYAKVETRVVERTAELAKANMDLEQEVAVRRAAEMALHKKAMQLKGQSVSLQEVNAALKVLLKQRDADKLELEEKVFMNVNQLIIVYCRVTHSRRWRSLTLGVAGGTGHRRGLGVVFLVKVFVRGVAVLVHGLGVELQFALGLFGLRHFGFSPLLFHFAGHRAGYFVAGDARIDLVTHFEIGERLAFVIVMAVAACRFIFLDMLFMAEFDDALGVCAVGWVLHLDYVGNLGSGVDPSGDEDCRQTDERCDSDGRFSLHHHDLLI